MRRKLVLVAVLVFAIMCVEALAAFQESRWQIMDLLAYPEKIEKKYEAYSVSKASWERNDLKDGTPRWLATEDIYDYELIGSPIESVTFTAGWIDDYAHGYELTARSLLLMQAMGLSKEKAPEIFGTLFNAAFANSDTGYFIEFQGIRIEMTFFELMSMLMIVLTKS